ncbi:MAG: class I SAM-dependent methyltransferase [Kiritimatiellia bacterium]
MITINNIRKFDFESVPIDPFWNTGIQKEQKMHRIHAYPAKFPAFITTKALDYAQNSVGLQPERIADIFCGCGTTALEAKRNSIDFWGCDINPVATLIAKAKSRKYQPGRVQNYFNKIVTAYDQASIADTYDHAPERLKYWYSQKQYNQLKHLKTIIFKKQYQFMLKANEEIEYLGNTITDIVTGSFLDDSWDIPAIDIIITSPPYVTSYEYADLHQLSSLWLESVDDYRVLRNGTIGSRHHDYNFNKEVKRLNLTGLKIVTHLLDQHKSKARSVAKYFLDMQRVAQKSFSILNEKGVALFVIGNTEYKNVRIDNAKHLSKALLDAGFAKISVTKRKISNKILTPYRDKYGRFTSNSNSRKVYSEEFIIIGRKNV